MEDILKSITGTGFQDLLSSFIEFRKKVEQYREKIPKYILIMAEHGWFLDMNSKINLPLQIVSKIKNNQLEAANESLIEYYKENLDSIFEKLINRHPKRKEMLTQILTSFKNNNHYVLIPAVLTQVDGICYDFTKKKFFIKDKNNNYLPEILSELEKFAINSSDIYLSPFRNKTPIMASEKDISKFPCNLNRHEILHGVRTDYGTEINSLKVISLLKYVSDTLEFKFKTML